MLSACLPSISVWKKSIHTHQFLLFLFFGVCFFLSSFDKCRKNVREKRRKKKREKSTNLLLLCLLFLSFALFSPLSLSPSFSQPFSWIASLAYAFFSVYRVTDWLIYIHRSVFEESMLLSNQSKLNDLSFAFSIDRTNFIWCPICSSRLM